MNSRNTKLQVLKAIYNVIKIYESSECCSIMQVCTQFCIDAYAALNINDEQLNTNFANFLSAINETKMVTGTNAQRMNHALSAAFNFLSQVPDNLKDGVFQVLINSFE